MKMSRSNPGQSLRSILTDTFNHTAIINDQDVQGIRNQWKNLEAMKNQRTYNAKNDEKNGLYVVVGIDFGTM
jgi:hypothetical protein